MRTLTVEQPDVLAPSMPSPRHAATRPSPGRQTWAISRAHAVAEVRMPLTPWRARLRVLGGRLTIPGDGSPARLSAVLAIQPVLVSVPLTGRLFLPGLPPTHRLMLLAEGMAARTRNCTNITAHADIWAGERRWEAPMRVQLRSISGGVDVLEVSAELLCRPYTWLYDRSIRIEGAAEVTRCD